MLTFAYPPSGNTSHVLRNPEARRSDWRTWCGRDAMNYNASEGDPNTTRFVESVFSCQRCLDLMTRPEVRK